MFLVLFCCKKQKKVQDKNRGPQNVLNDVPSWSMNDPINHFRTFRHPLFPTTGSNPQMDTVLTLAESHFFPISEFFYQLIRYLLNSSIVKFGNEIGFSY